MYEDLGGGGPLPPPALTSRGEGALRLLDEYDELEGWCGSDECGETNRPSAGIDD